MRVRGAREPKKVNGRIIFKARRFQQAIARTNPCITLTNTTGPYVYYYIDSINNNLTILEADQRQSLIFVDNEAGFLEIIFIFPH